MTVDIPHNQATFSISERTIEYPRKYNELELERDSRAGQKEAFMQLFAQEMVSSLLGNSDKEETNEDDDITMKNLQHKLKERQDVRKKLRRQSSRLKKKKGRKERHQNEEQSSELSVEQLEEMFYAQMTGQEVSSVTDSTEFKQRQVRGHGENLDDSEDDNDSFAGGCLDDLIISSAPSQGSRECRSSMSVDSRNGSCSHTSTTDRSCTSTSSDDLDVDEIREFVMKSIPQAVRDQIPASAWGQIFASEGTEGSESKLATESMAQITKQATGTPISSIDTDIIIDDDDALSEISVSTGLNIAFPDGKSFTTNDVEVDYHVNEMLADGELQITPKKCAWGSVSMHSEGPSESLRIASGRDSLASENTVPYARGGPKKVNFDSVYVRHYERILTDNPGVQSGPAIGIGWRFKRSLRFDVDDFEQCKGLPRRSDDLVLSRTVRENILRDCGYSQKDIADMVRVILKVRNQRKTTVNNLPAQGMEETVENARKTVSRLLRFGISKDIL
jgi:hypothetical protein